MSDPKKQLTKKIQRESSEWLDVQPAWLGDYSHTVPTGDSGTFYARLLNGKVIKVYNQARVPAIFDLYVRIGRRRSIPNVWQIIEVVEAWSTPATSGQIEYHHQQHEFPNGDTVWVDRKQIVPFTVLVTDAENFIVTVYGGVFVSPTGVVKISTQALDLSSYVSLASAQYVTIETDDDGALTVNSTGADFGAPAAATVSYIPAPDPGKYMLAYILLHADQTELSNDDIRVPMPIGILAKDTGMQIDEAAADTPLDADLFGFWDVVDAALKKISWANIKAGLETYFDTLYSALGHTHGASDLTGQYRQFVTISDGAGGWEFITFDGEPLFILQDLE